MQVEAEWPRGLPTGVIHSDLFPDNVFFRDREVSGLIDGYRQARPLTAAELAALPLLARGSALRFLLTRLFDWLNLSAGALVQPKDPLEFLRKLRFHRGITNLAAYGI